MRGLLIKSPWIELILEGRKTCEIRGSNTKIRGPIALIRSGSKLVVGTCELTGAKGPLTFEDMVINVDKHCIAPNDLKRIFERYSTPYAWVLKNVIPLERPIPYVHRRGAVIWVMLSDTVSRKVRRQTQS